MKIGHILIIVLNITIIGCSQSSKSKESKDIDDSLNIFEDVDSIKMLQGVWAINEDENALFTIKGDSIYYFEDPDPVFFLLNKNVFEIIIEEESYKSQVLKLTPDSLLWLEYDEIIKLYKRGTL